VRWLLRGALLALLVFAYFSLPALGSVNGRTLYTSVGRELGAELTAAPRACRRGGGVWRCTMLAFQGDSAGTAYTVRKRGRRCWTAYSRKPAPELPSLARGCAELREQGRVGRFMAEVLG
jgi:hypothetical protein